MTLSANKGDREHFKFGADGENETGVRVLGSNGWVSDKLGRKIQVTYPAADEEVFTYFDGSTQLYEITVIYTDSTKESVFSVERTA